MSGGKPVTLGEERLHSARGVHAPPSPLHLLLTLILSSSLQAALCLLLSASDPRLPLDLSLCLPVPWEALLSAYFISLKILRVLFLQLNGSQQSESCRCPRKPGVRDGCLPDTDWFRGWFLLARKSHFLKVSII